MGCRYRQAGTHGQPDSAHRVIGFRWLAFLNFNVRGHWIDHPSTREALDQALIRARSSRITRIKTQVDPDSTAASVLEAAGFNPEPPYETWQLSIPAGLRSTLPIVERLSRRFPVDVESLDAVNLAEAVALCEATGLLMSNRVFLSDPENGRPHGFDPRVSFLARKDGELVALILARPLNERLHIEVMAQNPDSETFAPSAIAALLRSFFLAADSLGVEMGVCTIQPTVSPNLSKLLRRSGGTRIARFGGFEWRS